MGKIELWPSQFGHVVAINKDAHSRRAQQMHCRSQRISVDTSGDGDGFTFRSAMVGLRGLRNSHLGRYALLIGRFAIDRQGLGSPTERLGEFTGSRGRLFERLNSRWIHARYLDRFSAKGLELEGPLRQDCVANHLEFTHLIDRHFEIRRRRISSLCLGRHSQTDILEFLLHLHVLSSKRFRVTCRGRCL